MNNKLIRLCLAILMFFPSLAFSAPNKPADNNEFQIFKSQTETKLDVLKEVKQQDLNNLKKDLEIQNEKIDIFDKRISDINLYLAIYAVLGTIVAIAVSLLALYTASSKARETAENWFIQNENGLLERLKNLEDKISARATQVHSTLDATEQNTIALGAEVANRISIVENKQPTKVSEADKATLENANIQLQEIPESQYNYNDWNTRAFAAYAEKNFALAAEFWNKASQVPNLGYIAIANATLNKGVALEQQGKHDDAIINFDEVINLASMSNLPFPAALLSTAIANKGSSLSQQNKFNEAIDCYSQIITRFDNSNLPDLKEHVAFSLLNKGVALSHLSKYDESAALYSEVIRRYNDLPSHTLQEQVAGALSGLGFDLVLRSKRAWEDVTKRTTLLTEALKLFEQAKLKQQNQSYKSTLLGNIAYSLWLLGKEVEANTQLHEALTLGGEKLRDAELGDTELYPVPPDAGFKNLINNVWSELHP